MLPWTPPQPGTTAQCTGEVSCSNINVKFDRCHCFMQWQWQLRRIPEYFLQLNEDPSQADFLATTTKVAGFVLMEDCIGKAKIYPHHFEVPKEIRSAPVTPQRQNSPASQTRSSSSSSPVSKTKRRLSKATSMLNTFSLSGLTWYSTTGKVELTAAEVESLRTEITNLEEREAHLKAQLEHLDELLRSARLAGYLYIRTRWTALPGEPPIEESEDVDDWLPRFLVLHGSCIFFFLHSADLSPQDSTLLSDIVDVGILPSFSQEDGQTRHSFFLLTKNGLRLECSTISEIQMRSWMTALEIDCNLKSESTR